MINSRPFIQRLADWLYRLPKSVPDSESAQCEYGAVESLAPRCEVIVAPYAGYRQGGKVYCTYEHAEDDLDMKIM
ncbi:hypothetical protein M1D93_14840 [Arthrobacter sp. Z1-9]